MIAPLRKLLKPILFKTKMTIFKENTKTKTIERETDYGRFIVQGVMGTKFEAVKHGLMKETPDPTKSLDPNHLMFQKKDFDNITQIEEVYNPDEKKIEYYIKPIQIAEYQKAYEESIERQNRNADWLNKFGPYIMVGVLLILGIVTITQIGAIATNFQKGSDTLASAINHDADVLADRNMINKIMLGINKTPYGIPENNTNITQQQANGGVPFKLW